MTRLSKTFAMSALLAAATGVATLGMTGPAMADGTPECNDTAGIDSTECGTNSDTGTADFATAVGVFASPHFSHKLSASGCEL